MRLIGSPMKRISFRYRKSEFMIEARRCSALRSLTGIMFRTRKTDNLLFEFSKAGKVKFTSLFVFFPYLTIWLDSSNNVLDFELTKPFQPVIRAKNNFVKVLELPLNKQNSKIIEYFVGEQRFK